MEKKMVMNPLDLPDLGDEYVPFRSRFREGDEKEFWFCNTMHVPRPHLPLVIELTVDHVYITYNQAQQLYYFPTKGMDGRFRMGRVYQTTIECTPEELRERWPRFEERSRFYTMHWEELVAEAYAECKRLCDELAQYDLKELPLYPDLSDLFEKAVRYNERQWLVQMEFLYLAYATYLGLFDRTLSEIFPEMGDEDKLKLIQGYNTSLYQRDSEMWRLSNLAIDLGLSDIFKKVSVDELQPRLEQTDAGRKWLGELKKFLSEWGHLLTQPWEFYRPTWFEDPRDCLAVIKGYVSKGKHDPEKEREKRAKEREDFFQELMTKVKDEGQKKALEMAVRTYQRIYPYLEDHPRYMEHEMHARLRYVTVEVGRRFVEAGIMDDPDDIWYLTLAELRDSLRDVTLAFISRGYVSRDLHPMINRRKEIWKKQCEWKPVLIVGTPKEVKEPMTLKLWGFSEDYLKAVEAVGITDTVTGLPGAKGVVEGKAKVVMGPHEFRNIEAGDILICPVTNPSWSPVFSMIRGVVADGGGPLSHTAIVSREYGIPAVVATAKATSVIKTGDKVRVDGTAGVVTILR